MMNVFRDVSEIVKDENTAVTIGTFDGLHIGHRDIINVLSEKAKENNCRSFVVTFEPHPRLVLTKESGIKIITPLEEKIKVFSDAGIDNLLILNFTKEFSQQTSEEFIENIIVEKIGVRNLIIGYDHKFGKNRGGNESTLRSLEEKYNFELTVVPAKKINDEIVSSTKIRNALAEGDLETVNFYLGRNYILIGNIVKGAGRGKTLGFPTANVKLYSPNKLVPKLGVYVVKCNVKNSTVYGVMNIGVRPTFENFNEFVIEVNLFDFNEDIYEEKMEVELLKELGTKKDLVQKKI